MWGAVSTNLAMGIRNLEIRFWRQYEVRYASETKQEEIRYRDILAQAIYLSPRTEPK